MRPRRDVAPSGFSCEQETMMSAMEGSDGSLRSPAPRSGNSVRFFIERFSDLTLHFVPSAAHVHASARLNGCKTQVLTVCERCLRAYTVFKASQDRRLHVQMHGFFNIVRIHNVVFIRSRSCWYRVVGNEIVQYGDAERTDSQLEPGEVTASPGRLGLSLSCQC